MAKDSRRETGKKVLAFAIVYLVWGSTFLAIRVGVHEVPPFLLAAFRFAVAGALLCGWMRVKGVPWPARPQWLSALALAALIFAGDYGLLFWAEQRVPSGIAAVMMATIPAFMALAEIVLLRTQRMTARLGLALAIGMAGVAVLTVRGVGQTLQLGGTAVDRAGAAALIAGAISWSLASALAKRLPLPESKAMSSGVQMLLGGGLLALIAAATGEWKGFDPQLVSPAAWWALIYLIVMGSIVGFTAYVWLIARESPTRVGTYAYVNPVVAVLLGYFVAGEQLGLRTAVGSALVLASVVAIATARAKAA